MVLKASAVVSFTGITSAVSLMGPKNICLKTGDTAARNWLCAPIFSPSPSPSSPWTRKTSAGRPESGERKTRRSVSAIYILFPGFRDFRFFAFFTLFNNIEKHVVVLTRLYVYINIPVLVFTRPRKSRQCSWQCAPQCAM